MTVSYSVCKFDLFATFLRSFDTILVYSKVCITMAGCCVNVVIVCNVNTVTVVNSIQDY